MAQSDDNRDLLMRLMSKVSRISEKVVEIEMLNKLVHKRVQRLEKKFSIPPRAPWGDITRDGGSPPLPENKKVTAPYLRNVVAIVGGIIAVAGAIGTLVYSCTRGKLGM